MPLSSLHNTPLRVKTPLKVKSANKYANTPSRLFATTPLAKKKAEEAKKIKERAEKKQQENAKQRKALIDARQADCERKLAEKKELAKFRYQDRKDLSEQKKKEEAAEKLRLRKRKQMDLMLSEQHKRQRRVKQQKERNDTFEENRLHSEDVAEYKVKEKLARRQSMAGRRAEHQTKAILAELEKEQDSFQQDQDKEMRRQEQEDVDAYKRKLKEDKRKSFAFRREEFQHHCLLEKLDAQIESEKELKEKVIKGQEREDVHEYQIQTRQQRRESMAFRRAESVRYKKMENAAQVLQQQQDKFMSQIDEVDEDDEDEDEEERETAGN